MSWKDIDFPNKTLTVRDTKNHEDHTLPLSDYLYTLLQARQRNSDCEWVFPSEKVDPKDKEQRTYLKEPRKHMQKISEAANVTYTLHDLRRTFVTYAERLDISAYAVKRLVNHKRRDDVTAGYIGPDIERLRRPMQAITAVFCSTHLGMSIRSLTQRGQEQ